MRSRLAASILVPLALATLAAESRGGDTDLLGVRRPRLTVVVVVDQLRADYLRRFDRLFDHERGGFARLLAAGSCFADARHEHFPLFTGPGHSVILTGAAPWATGIVGNDWFDRRARKSVYCVADPSARIVGASAKTNAPPVGPRNLLAPTIGDALKMAHPGAKVVSLSLKDRAAVLLGGHSADVCLWFDPGEGRWITSTAYASELPAWVRAIEDVPGQKLGAVWRSGEGIAPVFSHAIGKERTAANLESFASSPFANAWVLDTALAAVDGEALGTHEGGDLLALNLATNDHVGHAYGPFSPEVADITVETDRALGAFLAGLERRGFDLGRDLVFVLTSDHGVAAVPERLGKEVGGRRSKDAVAKAAAQALHAESAGTFVEPAFWLDDAAVGRAIEAGEAATRADVEKLVAEKIEALPGVYACYTRTQILAGALPRTEIAKCVARGFHPAVSGDLVVVDEPGWIVADEAAAAHGAPYPYDTHVPLIIAGPGIHHGVFTERVSPADIAPTLAFLLGIEAPAACDGAILSRAVEAAPARRWR
jgi:predicted AlkP superfamily pyrophosphatase or phosphodiesterase